jgi:hypothetical protein
MMEFGVAKENNKLNSMVRFRDIQRSLDVCLLLAVFTLAINTNYEYVLNDQ